MNKLLVTLSALASLSACSETDAPEADAAQPINCLPGQACSGAGVDGGGIVADAALPPGVGSLDGGQAQSSRNLPCDVEPLVTKYCGTCHGAAPQFGAPTSLYTQADFQAVSVSKPDQKRHLVAQARLKEADTKLRMPPPSQVQPSAEELAKLDAWLGAGAPAGTTQCSGGQPTPDAGAGVDGSTPPPGDEELECFKFLAHAPNSQDKFSVGRATDAYWNFDFSAPWQGAAYGVTIKPIIDNAKVIHHWLLFQQNAGVVNGGVSQSSGVHPTGELVHGWAPGGATMDFRANGDDVGYEFPAGSGFTMEYHYNSSDGAAKDSSGAEVCVRKSKPQYTASVSWLGTDLLNGATATSTCRPTSTQPIHILGVSPHMHVKGRHMKGIINRANGTTEVLHDGPFSFDDQTSYTKNVVINRGDSITTTCTYSGPVRFGPGTNDEMCYLFTVAYPKNALSDSGLVGTATHGGGSCLGI